MVGEAVAAQLPVVMVVTEVLEQVAGVGVMVIQVMVEMAVMAASAVVVVLVDFLLLLLAGPGVMAGWVEAAAAETKQEQPPGLAATAW